MIRLLLCGLAVFLGIVCAVWCFNDAAFFSFGVALGVSLTISNRDLA